MARKRVVPEGENKFRLTTGTPGRDEELVEGSVSIAGEGSTPDDNGVFELSDEQIDAVKNNPGLHLRDVDYEPPENAKKEPAPIKTNVLDKTASEEVKKIGKQISEEILPALKDLAERVDAADVAIKAFADLADLVEKIEKRVTKLEK